MDDKWLDEDWRAASWINSLVPMKELKKGNALKQVLVAHSAVVCFDGKDRPRFTGEPCFG